MASLYGHLDSKAFLLYFAVGQTKMSSTFIMLTALLLEVCGDRGIFCEQDELKKPAVKEEWHRMYSNVF